MIDSRALFTSRQGGPRLQHMLNLVDFIQGNRQHVRHHFSLLVINHRGCCGPGGLNRFVLRLAL